MKKLISLIFSIFLSINLFSQSIPPFYIDQINWEIESPIKKETESILKSNQIFQENSISINLIFTQFKEIYPNSWEIETKWTINKDLIENEELFSYKIQFKTTGKFNKEIFAKELCKSIKRDLTEWWNKNALNNPKLAKEIIINFIPDKKGIENSDTLCYPLRKLEWKDFKNRIPPNLNHAGFIMTNFEYSMKDSVVNGIIYVDIQLKTYMVKSQSGVSSEEEDIRVLNHEQKHFDIANEIAQDFKKKVISKKFRPLWYESEIYWLFLDANRDLDYKQKAFDKNRY